MKQNTTRQFPERDKAMNTPPKHRSCLVLILLWVVAINSGLGQAQNIGTKSAPPKNAGTGELPIQVNGVFPKLTVMAKGLGSDSEAGIGALIPWADRLWAIGYVSHIKGEGLGRCSVTRPR
ncbi:MAG: hypothetical protein ACYTFW_16860 [Planctomycetota bacterium]|jgi:hypothetical protein